MQMSLGTRRRLATYFVATLAGGFIGMAYVAVAYSEHGIEAFMLWRGFRAGLTISTLTLGFEMFVMRGAVGRKLARLRVASSLIIRELVLTALLMLGLFVNMSYSRWLDGVDPVFYYPPGQLVMDTAFSFIVTGLVLFVLQMRQLIGRRTFFNLLLGRYIRPVKEERIFVLFDLADSTSIAQRLGDEQFHALLSSVFAVADRTVEDHGGEVHAYVGDALIATWPLDDEASNGSSAEAVFAVRDALAARTPEFERKFGVRPVLRAAMHGGPVVVGECGDSKRQITYLGDALNVTARIEGLAKELGAGVLMSADLLSRLRLPRGLAVDGGGWHDLKGLSKPIQVFRLARERDRKDGYPEAGRAGALRYAGHSPGA
ncbi:MAG: adenylate/guanylate cyclase domain-containing protein [Parvibaculaceae bacterium]